MDSQSNGFSTVFEVSNSDYLSDSISSLILTVVLIVFVYFSRNIKLGNNNSTDPKFFIIFIIFVIAIVSSISGYSEHQRHKELVQNNTCRIVEGPVENFVPLPMPTRGIERFSVSGVWFEYSSHLATDAFHDTSPEGPITPPPMSASAMIHQTIEYCVCKFAA